MARLPGRGGLPGLRGLNRVGFCGGSQGGASAILAAARCPAAVAVVAGAPMLPGDHRVLRPTQLAHLPPVLARPAPSGPLAGSRLGFRLRMPSQRGISAPLPPRGLLIHGPRPYIPTSGSALFDTAGQPRDWICRRLVTQALELRPEDCRRASSPSDRWLSASADPAGQP